MDKAKHSSSLAQDGPALGQAQEPAALYCAASVAAQGPNSSAKAFAWEENLAPGFCQISFMCYLWERKELQAKSSVGSRDQPVRGEQDMCQDTSLGSTGGAQHSRTQLQARLKPSSHNAWRGVDIFHPLPSVLDFDSLLCLLSPSLSSAILRPGFGLPSRVCLLLCRSPQSQQDAELQPSHLLQESLSFPLPLWSPLMFVDLGLWNKHCFHNLRNKTPCSCAAWGIMAWF